MMATTFAVHQLPPAESFALGDFYKAQKYHLLGVAQFERSICFVLRDTAIPPTTQPSASTSAGSAHGPSQCSVSGCTINAYRSDRCGKHSEAVPAPPDWVGGVRLVKAPRQIAAAAGSKRVVWILRELCVSVQHRRRGLGTLLASDPALVALGPTYCYCVRAFAPVYEKAGFDKLEIGDVDVDAAAGRKTYTSRNSTGVPGWLVEIFFNIARKQKKKQKPELVLMTRGFRVDARGAGTAATATPKTAGCTAAVAGMTVFGCRTEETAQEVALQVEMLYGTPGV